MNIASMLAYTPFVTPLPVWDYWMVLLLPLSIAVAIVYKSIKCQSMNQVPREAAIITVWIIVGFALAGAALAGLVKFLEM
jgi:hypothetical protein